MRLCKTAAILSIITLSVGVIPGSAQTHEVPVGHPSVDGGKLRPFTGSWQSFQFVDGERVRGGVIRERMEVGSRDGRETWRRIQTIEAPGGRMVETVVEMDRRTLAPIALDHTKTGEFPGPVVRSFSARYDTDGVTGERTLVNGEVDSIPLMEMGSKGFETDVMGLVLAALPLEEGYQAELPSVYAQLGDAYMIRPRVNGTQDFTDANGHTVTAWRVEVEWLNLRTDDIYVAGDEGSGGTYYVVTDPPEGFPFVPRYVNENTDIVVTFGNPS